MAKHMLTIDNCHCMIKIPSDIAAWKCNLKYGSWSFDGLQIGLDEYEGMYQ